MKTRLGALAARLVAVAVVVGCSLAVAAPASAHTISGTVTSSATGQAAAGVELQLWYYDADDTAWYRAGVYAESALNGSYALNFSNDGQYRVQCAYNHVTAYAEEWWYDAPTPATATTITVPGDTLTGIDFALTAAKTETSLSLSAPAVCPYRSATLTGYLLAAGAQALAGRDVVIQYDAAGVWKTVGHDFTDAAGLYRLVAAPSSKTTYRAVFAEDATHLGATSVSAVVLPKVYLTRPSGPASARTTTTFSSSCYLKPRHTKGTYPVSIQCQRLESGKWVTRKSVKAKAADYSSYTRCVAGLRLGLKGSWRIRAVHALDSRNALTASSWRSIRVY